MDNMSTLNGWIYVTQGVYRYVIASNVAYLVLIRKHNWGEDIYNSDADLYLAGDWAVGTTKERYFAIEQLHSGTLKECLEAAINDYTTNCQGE